MSMEADKDIAGICDSKRMAAVFPGGIFEMPVGFCGRYRYL